MIYFIELIHLREKNGITYLPQDSTKEQSLWLHVTRLPVLWTLLILWEVVSSKSHLQTATINLKLPTGESLSSSSMKLKDLTATLTSTAWTSPEIRPAQWLRNGTLSLRLSYKPRPPMVTSSECSALLSPRRHINKLKQHATPRLPTRSSLEKRWWKSCNPLYKSQLSRSLWRHCKYYCVCFSRELK